jgi:hypothetical protein
MDWSRVGGPKASVSRSIQIRCLLLWVLHASIEIHQNSEQVSFHFLVYWFRQIKGSGAQQL